MTVSESVAFNDENVIEGSPDDIPDEESGRAPTVRLPLSEMLLSIGLVTSPATASTVVGFRVFVKGELICTHKLHYSFKLEQQMRRTSLRCYQLSGQLSNDGKQINILTG